MRPFDLGAWLDRAELAEPLSARPILYLAKPLPLGEALARLKRRRPCRSGASPRSSSPRRATTSSISRP